MALYEHVLLARQDVSAQQVEALVEQFKGILEANGGSVAKVEYWGVKSLGYRIKKNRKAHYSLLNIDAPPAAVAEMERQMRINEDVLRFMTIRVALSMANAMAYALKVPLAGMHLSDVWGARITRSGDAASPRDWVWLHSTKKTHAFARGFGAHHQVRRLDVDLGADRAPGGAEFVACN